MAEKDLQTMIDAFRAFVRSRGWSIVAEKEIAYLRNALGKKGRQIKLEQRPRAESDIAVAAASILARADFVRQMEQLSSRVGKKLPKGAFDLSIITIGREIVAQGVRVRWQTLQSCILRRRKPFFRVNKEQLSGPTI